MLPMLTTSSDQSSGGHSGKQVFVDSLVYIVVCYPYFAIFT